MKTDHAVVTDDARTLALPADSVDLVVTSPPYPMIEMWDDIFAALDPAIGDALDADDGERAFEAMHDVLDTVWAQLDRVLVDGGIAAINVGDATRTLDRFRQYPNAGEITRRMVDYGFDPLPDIVWRKPANSGAKFMGSGMVPPNAYPTLEHESILLFRNGPRRSFPPGDQTRYESAYFWEERNRWFSDLWEITGTAQGLDAGLRERSGAFPVEIPLRLIRMFSVYGDTVLDPFWGTGTTTLAAMLAGRESVGYERDADLRAAFDDRIEGLPERSRERGARRLERHREWVNERQDSGEDLGYENDHYDTPVRTKQERQLRLYAVESVAETAEGYSVRHTPIENLE
ncbi:site-specific DNA-methyltransferase [Halorhabdus sp. SVX81]|uniref:DNA-methyltransferase n=1 Tax=Halorhabdus sp. SVX81 TaxID=2978283 RepID=UPI0023DC56F4|nr:site-specific DNA-methyltransferase [Halorhabdus sp. SVX81]